MGLNLHYQRVLPRDVFNEAKLLKCVGRLIVAVEDREISGLNYFHDGEPFRIAQETSDGSLTLSNIGFYTPKETFLVCTPLNSKETWPLMTLNNDEEEIEVFNSMGELTLEFRDFISEGQLT